MYLRRRWISLCVLALFVGVFGLAEKKVSDDEIYDQVRLKLASDRDVKGGNLEVEVQDGVVTLRGRVDNEKARNKAERLTKRVKGVTKVVNELKAAIS